uniref:Transmembrane protein Vc182 n=1 Tax=Ciona intestinalis TaxID=7719 RepID=F6VWW5_CIOIN
MKSVIFISLCILWMSLNVEAACTTSVECPTSYQCVSGTCIASSLVNVNNLVGGCTSDFECLITQRCSNGVCVASNTADSSSVCNPNPCKAVCQCVPSCRHENGFYCLSSLVNLGRLCTIPSPQLDCQSNAIRIDVPEEMLREYGVGLPDTHIFMGSLPPNRMDQRNGPANLGACAATTASGGFLTITMQLPFNTCGTQMAPDSENSNGQVFTNEVWLNTDGVLFDVPIPVFRWSCTYNSNYKVLASIRPTVGPIRIDKLGTVVQQASVELCKVASACPGSCPPLYNVNKGAVYTVSETIHASIRAVRDQNNIAAVTTVYLKNLYLSCNRDPGSVDVSLVTNGCVESVLSTSISLNGVGSVVCVSFRVPRMLSCQSFYIHGSLASGTTPIGCSARFRSATSESDAESVPEVDAVSQDPDVESEPVSKRKRRFASSFRLIDPTNQTGVIRVGPITIIRGNKGKAHFEAFPVGSDISKRGVMVNKQTTLTDPQPASPAFSQQAAVLVTSIVGGFALLMCFISLYVYFTRVRTVSK